MYYRLEIQNINLHEEEDLTSFLFDHGASGVSEALDFEQTSGTYEPKLFEKEIKTLEAYFSHIPYENFLKDLEERFPQSAFLFTEEKDQDWLEEWKKGYQSFLLVEDVWVVPSWLPNPKEAKKILKIDPGMAFGTGTHETTQICAGHISSLLKEKHKASALDVGCGTAILSMLCEIYGVKEIDATEIDVDARECAKKNILNNQMMNIQILDHQIEEISKRYELVIANIIDGVLVRLRDSLIDRVASGGHLILSGILQERSEDFESRFITKDLKLLKKENKGEWLAYTFEKIK